MTQILRLTNVQDAPAPALAPSNDFERLLDAPAKLSANPITTDKAEVVKLHNFTYGENKELLATSTNMAELVQQAISWAKQAVPPKGAAFTGFLTIEGRKVCFRSRAELISKLQALA
jgi:hypothetical protein